jgi:MFS family permease
MPKPSPRVVIATLGITQILAWGSSFYLPAVLAQPIAADTGWSLGWVVGGLSVGLLAAGLVAPRVGRTIDARGGHPVLVASSVLLAAGLATLALAHSCESASNTNPSADCRYAHDVASKFAASVGS